MKIIYRIYEAYVCGRIMRIFLKSQNWPQAAKLLPVTKKQKRNLVVFMKYYCDIKDRNKRRIS